MGGRCRVLPGFFDTESDNITVPADDRDLILENFFTLSYREPA